MKDKIGEDGKVELITSETQKFDTLSNGKIIKSFNLLSHWFRKLKIKYKVKSMKTY